MLEFTENSARSVIVENKTIIPWREYKGTELVPSGPSDFKTERTTVWSFPRRGNWASHTPQYRGNWAPEVVRNILELYSKPGDTVLDPMVGGGTTPVECLLTGRNSVSVDINPDAVSITRDRLDLPRRMTEGLPRTTHRTYVGDARDLDLIPDGSIDLIATHPPYVNIIRYTGDRVEGDLSNLDDYMSFFREYRRAIAEYRRVLRPDGYCAVLMGDTHNRRHYVPATTRLMLDFLREGFVLKEDIIKREWNCESDRYPDRYANAGFLLTMHEHLFVFRKPLDSERLPNSSIGFLMGRSPEVLQAPLDGDHVVVGDQELVDPPPALGVGVYHPGRRHPADLHPGVQIVEEVVIGIGVLRVGVAHHDLRAAVRQLTDERGQIPLVVIVELPLGVGCEAGRLGDGTVGWIEIDERVLIDE